MPTITFYTHVDDIETFACRLSKRAVAAGKRVLLWSDDSAQIERLDQALWSFEAESFLPHQIWSPPDPYPAEPPILLAAAAELPRLPADYAVLNLSEDFWHQAPQIPQRILEIIGHQAHQLAAARQRFAAYKQQGWQLEHHNMQGKA